VIPALRRAGRGQHGAMIRSMATGAVLAAALAAPAAATAAGEGQTAPLYPNNVLTVKTAGTIVAGVPTTVTLAGHADWNEPTSETTTSYSLYLYAADRSVDRQCAASYSEQLSKSINLPGLSASAGVGGFVVSNLNLGAAPPAPGRDYALASTPFVIRPGVREVLLCAYQRFIVDDVAVYALPVKVAQPSCRPASTRVTRGRALRLRCNVSGPATVVFARRGGGKRTVSAKLSTRDGRGTARTRGLRAGTYRVSVASKGVALGRFDVRIR
jgi:hypothetical protein